MFDSAHGFLRAEKWRQMKRRKGQQSLQESYDKVVSKAPGARCNICLIAAPLTEDHVPPKCCVEELDVEIEPFEYRLNSRPPRLPWSQSGMRFKTICAGCNSMLGSEFDPALGTVAKQVRAWLRSSIALSNRWEVRVDPTRVIRSIFGHLLAADGDDPDTVQDRQMRDYVLGRCSAPDSCVRVLYWLHDSPNVVVLRSVAMPATRGDFRKAAIFSILKFPPLGFVVANVDTYDGLPRLDSIEPHIGNSIGLRFWTGLTRSADWPERIDDGNYLIGGRSLRDARTARPRKRTSKLR